MFNSAVAQGAANRVEFNSRNQEPDICLTKKETAKLQAIYRANIKYRRQFAR